MVQYSIAAAVSAAMAVAASTSVLAAETCVSASGGMVCYEEREAGLGKAIDATIIVPPSKPLAILHKMGLGPGEPNLLCRVILNRTDAQDARVFGQIPEHIVARLDAAVIKVAIIRPDGNLGCVVHVRPWLPTSGPYKIAGKPHKFLEPCFTSIVDRINAGRWRVTKQTDSAVFIDGASVASDVGEFTVTCALYGPEISPAMEFKSCTVSDGALSAYADIFGISLNRRKQFLAEARKLLRKKGDGRTVTADFELNVSPGAVKCERLLIAYPGGETAATE